MDTEAFVRWALADTRTIEERYTTELLVEHAVTQWHIQRRIPNYFPWKKQAELKRQRFLNPAYQPEYSEQDLRRAAEVMANMKEWGVSSGWQERPVRDIAVVRFLPALEKLSVGCEIADASLFAELPRLRVLSFISPICEDYRPLARCTQLTSLSLLLAVHWPEIDGLEKLQQLEFLSLTGNLLVFPRGITFPRVRQATLGCSPLHARNVRDLPQLPACEFLALSGVERLDGIEALPRLRNLMLTGPVRDFAPLAALENLTWLHYHGTLPLDVAPLARLPRLLCAIFNSQHAWGAKELPMRDYAPLNASPQLREFQVQGCPPLEMEVAALNALLPSWADLFLAAEPSPVPPLRIIVAPPRFEPRRDQPHRAPDEPDLIDGGIRKCEGCWVARFLTAAVSERIGHSDWGKVEANGEYRTASATVECFEVVERLPEILDALRGGLAQLRHEYLGHLHICLRVPPPEPTEAQAEMLRRFRQQRDDADLEQRQRDERERLERLYLYQLKQQEGEEVDPEEFAAPPPEPPPPAPWEVEEDEDEDDEDLGGFAVKEKIEPPPMWWDDDHPLADNYRLYTTFTLGEFWLGHHNAGLGLHLMRREADEVIPEEKPA